MFLLLQIVLLLRLVPLVPFTALNYLLSVTPISIHTYVAASSLGMLVRRYILQIAELDPCLFVPLAGGNEDLDPCFAPIASICKLWKCPYTISQLLDTLKA
jgi:hypothetical protein